MYHLKVLVRKYAHTIHPNNLSKKYTSIFEIYLRFLQLDRNSITKSTRFVTKVHADFIDKMRTGELDTEQKQKKLLDANAEELRCESPERETLQVLVCWLRGPDRTETSTLHPPQRETDFCRAPIPDMGSMH